MKDTTQDEFYAQIVDAEEKQRAGMLDEAAQAYLAIIAQSPAHPVALFQLGFIADKQGDAITAEKYYRQTIAARPTFAEAHFNLAVILSAAQRYGEAVQSYKNALTANPRMAAGYYRLGVLMRDGLRANDALACFLKAAELAPDADTYANIGVLYHLRAMYNEANKYYLMALESNPNHIDTLNNIGALYGQIGQQEQALAYYERAFALRPDNLSTINNLGILYKATGRLEKSMEYYRRGIELSPILSLYTNLLLSMVYAPHVPPEELTRTAREFGKKLADPLIRQRGFTNEPVPGRRLRIGYVSPDFRKHAVNYFFEHLLHNHDKSQFEVFGYSNTAGEDEVTLRLKKSFDHWCDLTAMDDDKAADRIEADKIDILIDLSGHTGRNRLLIFARKPAPVQASWLGFPATTGMKAMDYRITDIYAEPEGMTEHLSVEKLWRLPQIFCCFGPQDGSIPVIDHPPLEDNGYITFGCFNNFTKVTDDVLRVWARIMAAVPDSRLLLEIFGLESKSYQEDIIERLQRAGIELGRVMLQGRSPENQYVLYNRIDMALDPFPCNGGTTSMDTLWMGVPFVTLAGRHFVSRMGVTILTNVGLDELIANNEDEYVAKAVALAQDRDRLRALRCGLRERVMKTPMMDQKLFVRNMEDAYRGMWSNWCEENEA
jgi:predicted O-linked N-acetylglucosamine transferase (SPINDLY family)